jgi:hypothetical protein
MKMRITVLAVLTTVLFCSPSRAMITNAWWWDDGDGALVCSTTNWNAGTGVLSMAGDQYWGPGHMVGWVQTTGPTDPTLTLASDIENDTNFAWTAYIVNVYMSNTFTLSNFQVITPGDWSVVSVSPLTPTNGLGSYVVSTLLDTGAPIPVGNDIAFQYQLSFSGASNFHFTQEVIPVPEPETFALVALTGGLLVLGRRRHRT